MHEPARLAGTAVSLPPASERLDIENSETAPNRPLRKPGTAGTGCPHLGRERKRRRSGAWRCGAERRATLAEGVALTERDGYEHGVPCWVETWQQDPDTAAMFYTGVFGWEVEKGAPPGT